MYALCGAVLWLLGTARMVRVVNFLPYPVTAGMLASIGVSLCKSGARVAAAPGFRVSAALGSLWLGLALGLAFAMRRARRAAKALPTWLPPVAVVVAGTGLLRAGMWLMGVDAAAATRDGALFHWDAEMLALARGWAPLLDVRAIGGPKAPNGPPVRARLPLLFEVATCLAGGRAPGACAPSKLAARAADGVRAFFKHVQWAVVFECRGVIAAAVTIGAIKIGIKTGAFPGLFPDSGVDADAEVAMIGAANVAAAALLGAQGTAYSFSALKLAQQLGASPRGVGSLVPALCLLAWAYGFGSLRHVPRFVYGALLLDLGWDYVETYLLGPLRRGGVFLGDVDVLAVVAVVATAVAASLLEAVGVGVVLCLVGTAARLAKASVVAGDLSGAEARSTIERSYRQQLQLDKHGGAIRVLQLRGYIFFGSAADILAAVRRHAGEHADPPLRHLVVDLENCYASALDLTAVETFQQLARLGSHLDFQICLAPPLELLKTALRGADAATFYETADDALEACEDALLESVWSRQLSSDGSSFGSSPSLNHKSAASTPSPKVAVGAPPAALLRDWLAAADDDAADDPRLAPLVDALAPHVGPRRYAARDFVYRRGDPKDDAFYLCIRGRLRLLAGDPARCIRKLGRGNVVGAGDFYAADDDLAPGGRSETLVATAASTILRLPHAAVHGLDLENPALAAPFHRLMARMLSGKNRNSKLALYRFAHGYY
mmetsp:Transcript_16684/g.51958  ORF Transcript_16684/g.51958 Transcript_16684/m.51958 type:complete len:719 (-) Transcript_16684:44-2200(-)